MRGEGGFDPIEPSLRYQCMMRNTDKDLREGGSIIVGYFFSDKKEHSLRSRNYLNEEDEEGMRSYSVHSFRLH